VKSVVEAEATMHDKRHYSSRKGLCQAFSKLELPLLRDLFLARYSDFVRRGYFEDAFGATVMGMRVPGYIDDIAGFFLAKLRKHNLWPIGKYISHYSEDDLFDVIELLYELVDKPGEAAITAPSTDRIRFRGDVANRFGREAAQIEFRAEVNHLLKDYRSGYELSQKGEVIELADSGLQPLLQEGLPQIDPANVEARVDAAVRRFLQRGSSLDGRKEAVRALADVLEFLRPRLKRVLTRKDERDLFNIANNFGIRHHDIEQKTDYDQEVWLPWMFYFYLATIHAATRLIRKADTQQAT